MATIDFPASPAVGQEYSFGDFIYVWDGVKWTTKVIIGSTEESDARYVNSTGDTITGTIIIDSSNPGQPSLRIVNHPSTSGFNAVGIEMYDNAETVREVGLGSLYNNGVYQFSYVGGGATPWDSGIEFHPGLMLFNSNPESYVSQGTTGGSLTRKDYVDAATKGFGLGTETPKPQDADLIENICTFLGGGGENGFNYFDNYAPGIQMFRSGGTGGDGSLGQMQLASEGMAWRLRNNNVWSEWGRVYDTLRPPTALEVGAVPREEFDSVVGALMARFEELESRLPPALVI